MRNAEWETSKTIGNYSCALTIIPGKLGPTDSQTPGRPTVTLCVLNNISPPNSLSRGREVPNAPRFKEFWRGAHRAVEIPANRLALTMYLHWFTTDRILCSSELFQIRKLKRIQEMFKNKTRASTNRRPSQYIPGLLVGASASTLWKPGYPRWVIHRRLDTLNPYLREAEDVAKAGLPKARRCRLTITRYVDKLTKRVSTSRKGKWRNPIM